MRLIDADKLLESMNKRYGEKKDIVPDNLAEGFMQMDKLIHEQGAFDLDEHDNVVRAEVIDECLDEILNLKVLIHNDFDYVSCALVINKLEQLKEKTNE